MRRLAALAIALDQRRRPRLRRPHGRVHRAAALRRDGGLVQRRVRQRARRTPPRRPMCLRSTVNYPHVIAAEVPVQLTDVTCGGADTSDYSAAQYQGVAPQLDAVQKDTQLITMTIGGNDSNVFIDSILECGAAGLSTRRAGQPVQGQVRLVVRGHHQADDVPVAGEGAQGRAGQGAEGPRRHPRLPLDPAGQRAGASRRCRSPR